MTKYKVNGNFTLEVDDSGSTARDLTAYLTEIDDFGKVVQEVPGTTFADDSERVLAGIEASQTLGLTVFFDDTATSGPDAVLNDAVGQIRTVKITAKSSVRSFQAEMLCTELRLVGQLGQYEMYRAVFRQDDGVTVST